MHEPGEDGKDDRCQAPEEGAAFRTDWETPYYQHGLYPTDRSPETDANPQRPEDISIYAGYLQGGIEEPERTDNQLQTE